MSSIDNMIKKVILESLLEQSSHQNAYSKVLANVALNAAPGNFSFPSSSRADHTGSAQSLLGEIGISSEVGGDSDGAKLNAFVKKALSNSKFSDAYSVSSSSASSISVKSNIASYYGVKFMQLLLVAGINSGYLKLDKRVKIQTQSAQSNIININVD